MRGLASRSCGVRGKRTHALANTARLCVAADDVREAYEYREHLPQLGGILKPDAL